MCNKQSEFLYHPIDVVEAFSMRRQAFREMLKTPEAQHLKNEIKINYKYGIQYPVYEHRGMTSRKFQGRIDYVNMGAYGIDKNIYNKTKNYGEVERKDDKYVLTQKD